MICSLLFFVTAWSGVAFTRGSENVATIWVANAILLAFVLNARTSMWLQLLVSGYAASVAANVVAGHSWEIAFALSACNIFEVVLIAVLLARTVKQTLDLTVLKHFWIFVLVGGLVAPALTGLLAAGFLAFWTGLPILQLWVAWYPADALGILVVTPLLLLFRLGTVKSLLEPGLRVESFAWLVAIFSVTLFAFSQNHYPLLFLPMALLGTIAVRLGPPGMTLGIGFVAVIASVETIRGHGPLMLVPGISARILMLQIFIAIIVLAKLPLAALFSNKARLEADLRKTNENMLLAERIAQVGHWHFNLVTNVLTWSDEVYRMHGLDRAKHTPTVETAIGAYHPDDRGLVTKWLARAVEGHEEPDLALRLVRTDGVVRYVITRALRETDAADRPTAVFGTIMDVTAQRDAERAVFESEARYRLLADHTADMITHMDLAGRRMFVSPGSYALLGFEPAELVGTIPNDMIHPDDLARFKATLEDLKNGLGQANVVNRLRHKNGDWIWIEASLKALKGPDGATSSFVASVRNIMDRRRSEDALRESEARYRLLADHSSDLIALKPRFDSRRSYVSPSVRSVFGYEPDEFAALSVDVFVHPDDQALARQNFESLSADNPQVNLVHRVKHKDGRWLWADITFRLADAGGPDQTVIVRARDITARHEAEQALAASEARYRLLADNVSDLIVLGHLDGRRSYISPAVRTMLGYTVEEAHRVKMKDWVHPDDLDMVFRVTSGLSKGAPTASVTYRLKHKDGHYLWAEAAFQRVEEGEDVRIVTTIRDINERAIQADLLKRAKGAAEVGARIKAEFLANMSHELRTPLTGILGILDLLRSDSALGDRQRHLVDLAHDSGRSLSTIVNDILDFSKIEAGQMVIEHVPFSLREIVTSCRKLGTETIKTKAVTLRSEIDPAVPDMLLGDPVRIRQVLANLISNAVKFTPEGEITISARWAAGRMRLAVKDTGVGIPAEAMPSLFERFSQADGSIARRFGGTGLGLSICRRLAGLMGGEVGVESHVGEGSVFWFELPLVSTETDGRERQRESSLAVTAIQSRRILVAEDNAINQEIIRTVLVQKGHQVTMVGDGAAAASTFESGTFDIVLMDVQMPGTDGLAATAMIRAIEREAGLTPIPIVALTANAMSEEAERCRNAGMDDHIAKPIDWDELFHTIECLCAAKADLQPRTVGTAMDPVALDDRALHDLAALVGRPRLAELLAAFEREIKRRMSLLESAALDAGEFGAHVHALVSVGGQLGFAELTALCMELEQEALVGGGLDRIDQLRHVAARALQAAVSSRYARAA